MRDKYLASSSTLKRLRVKGAKKPLHSKSEKAFVGINLHVKKFDLIMDFLDKDSEADCTCMP